MWFTDVANGIVYKMTTAGVMTPFPTPEEQRGKATFPGIIRAASDGNLYYYDQQEDHFHSISTNGTYATIGVTTTPGTSSFMVQSAGSGSVLFGTGGITVYDTATRKSVILPTTHRFGPRPHAVASETVAPDGSIWFLCLLARAPGQPICLGHLLLTSTWSLFPSGATHLDINKRTHPGWATELIGIGESGNSGPFTAASSNSAVVTVSKITPSGYTHNFLITGTSVGSATVTIRDAHGRSAPIPVSVTN